MELDIHTQQHILCQPLSNLKNIFEFILWTAFGHSSVHHAAFAKELGCHVLSFPHSERNIWRLGEFKSDRQHICFSAPSL